MSYLTYDKALEMMRRLTPLLERLDGELADQLRRAGRSVVLNTNEGSGRIGRDRAHFLRIAFASGREVRGGLDTAVIESQLTAPEAAPVLATLDEVCAMLYRQLQNLTDP